MPDGDTSHGRAPWPPAAPKPEEVAREWQERHRGMPPDARTDDPDEYWRQHDRRHSSGRREVDHGDIRAVTEQMDAIRAQIDGLRAQVVALAANTKQIAELAAAVHVIRVGWPVFVVLLSFAGWLGYKALSPNNRFDALEAGLASLVHDRAENTLMMQGIIRVQCLRSTDQEIRLSGLPCQREFPK